MAGIESITQRILSDAREKAEAIVEKAEREADALLQSAADNAQRARSQRLAYADAEAARARQRRIMVARMQQKQELLAQKQELLDETYRQAMQAVLDMPQEQYEELLATLIAQASDDGREEVVLCARDRERLDAKRLLARAEGLLRREGADKPSLTLSAQTLGAQGGFVLKKGDIETNCTLETLLARSRETLEQELAVILFH